MRKCLRCGDSFEPPDPTDFETNICGSCADELRQEEMAQEEAARAESEAMAEAQDKAKYESEKEQEEAEKFARGGY